MNVRLAAHAGFCFGVRRAIQLALEAQSPGAEVCTLGELIHNPQIVADLAAKGITARRSLTGLPSQTVVIRSHGIPKQELADLRQAGHNVVDATCPYVKRAQELVASLAEFPVMIMGDPEHPEVRAMLSYGNEKTQVVQADSPLPTKVWKTLCLVSQTTQPLENLQRLAERLLPTTLELRVFNTICTATSQRQASAVALARCSDLMVVIGGRNSANTRSLQQLCEVETRSAHIETESEIAPELLAGARNVGLTAGASTPEETIVNVFNQIKKINGEADRASGLADIPLFKEESC